MRTSEKAYFRTFVNKLPLRSGAAEPSAIPARRVEDGGEHRIDLGQVRSAYVIAFFERGELRSRDLARRHAALGRGIRHPWPLPR